MNILERLQTETPSLIKKVQKATTTLGTFSTIATGVMAKDPTIELPWWVPATIAFITALNHFILQLTTHSDFEKK